MTAREQATVHQLLGRIVYLHALFIEPHDPVTAPRVSAGRLPCCNHTAATGPTRPTWSRSSGSAWTVLLEVANSLPDTSRCRQLPDDCCATCVIAVSAAAIVRRWIDVEREAYGSEDASPDAYHGVAQLAGARLARAFGRQHAAACRALTAEIDVIDALSPEVLPLTGELLALWANPTGTDQAPVVSWLNHCAGLADVARIVESRRTTA